MLDAGRRSTRCTEESFRAGRPLPWEDRIDRVHELSVGVRRALLAIERDPVRCERRLGFGPAGRHPAAIRGVEGRALLSPTDVGADQVADLPLQISAQRAPRAAGERPEQGLPPAR
jgi:hypothetical protein